MDLNIMNFHKKLNFGNFCVSGPPYGEKRVFFTFLQKKIRNFNKEKPGQNLFCLLYGAKFGPKMFFLQK